MHYYLSRESQEEHDNEQPDGSKMTQERFTKLMKRFEKDEIQKQKTKKKLVKQKEEKMKRELQRFFKYRSL